MRLQPLNKWRAHGASSVDVQHLSLTPREKTSICVEAQMLHVYRMSTVRSALGLVEHFPLCSSHLSIDPLQQLRF